MESHELFAQSDLEPVILPISASQADKIAHVSHWHPTSVGFLRTKNEQIRSVLFFDIIFCNENIAWHEITSFFL
jgi:hypothetical protein